MNKKKYIVTALSLASFISSCSQYAYQQLPTPANLPGTWRAIVLNNSYDFYYRAIRSEDRPVPGTNKTQTVLGLAEDSLAFKSRIARKQNSPIIEIEYMWVSLSEKIVVYISTVADKFENRYSDPLRFAGLDHPNGADFRVFLIGKLTSSNPYQFVFYSKDHKHLDYWTIDKIGSDTLALKRIEQKRYTSFEEVYEIDDAMAHGMKFIKLRNWHIVFVDKNAKNKSSLENIKNNSIYYLNRGRKFQLFIPFTSTTLSFKNNFIIYRPDHKAM